MRGYNKVMELFWLFISIAIIVSVTVMCFIEGWERWATSYALAFIALSTYFIRRFMRKRMEKHQAFLNQQRPSDTTSEKNT